MDISVSSEKSIGMFLSGGMDSALLLYLLAQQSNKIKIFTIPKYDGAEHYVGPIVTWINNKLGCNLPEPILIGNPKVNHKMQVNTGLIKVYNSCDVFYFAGNSYPEDILPNGPSRTERKNPKEQQPFFHLYKTDIVKMYVQYDLMELLSLTHTCTEQSIGRCNECWQCKERAWAFKECGLQDLTNT
jgi:7-cyano-7-deazaguanine synthase in queuosine biosynthesis